MGFLDNLKEKLDLKKIQKSIEKPKVKIKKNSEDLKFKVGTTSGIYHAARSEELADIIGKLSYTLTRGAAVLELASDVPHEVNYTQGKEVRHISEKQGVEITFHGSLSVAMCYPDTVEWGTAQEHMEKSIKSAVHAGAKYIDFHSCLHPWLELFTYAGSRLNIIMSDCRGNFIGKMFEGNHKLSNWFVNDTRYRFREKFFNYIMGDKGSLELQRDMDEFINDLFEKKVPEIREKLRENFIKELKDRMESLGQDKELTTEQIEDIDKNVRATIKEFIASPSEVKVNQMIRNFKVLDNEEYNRKRYDAQTECMKKILKEHLTKFGTWYEKERTPATLEMAYYIIAHDLYIKASEPGNENSIWNQMVDLYFEDLKRLGYKPYDENLENLPNDKRLNWLEKTIIGIEEEKDKELVKTFKEFYYGVVAIKFLQGHIEKAIEWMEEDLPHILKEEVKLTEPDPNKVKEQQDELIENAKQLAIAIENPDARDPSQGGRFLLWRPKQIYLAIKNIRESLKNGDDDHPDPYHHWDKIFVLIDFEHLATQGVDPLEELTEMVKNEMTKDYGELVKAVHAGVPTPLHSHKPLGPEDREIVYRLLWKLREAGLGKKVKTYLIFERGGFKDPFKGSVKALKDMKKLLEEGVEPGKLPAWFFEIPHPKYEARQKAIIFEHTFDPIKGLLKFPEEEYTLLGSAAIKAGKRPEEWKKEELK